MKQVYACAVAFMLITGNADSQNLKPHQKTSSGSKFSIRTDSQIPDHFSVETDPEATKLKIDFEVPVNGIYPAQHHTPLNLSRNNNGIKNLTRIPALSSNHEHSALLQESDLAWWWAFNYSWDEFDVLLDSMANEGYRLEDIDVYGQTDLYFAGTWVKDESGWSYAVNFSYAGFLDLLQQWRQNNPRYNVIDFEVYHYNGELYYAAVGKVDNYEYAWALDKNWSNFVQWLEVQEGDGNRLIDIEAYEVKGANALRFAGVAINDKDKDDFWALNYEWTAFDSLLDELWGISYRLLDYEVYVYEGTQWFAGTWIKDNSAYASILNFDDPEEFVGHIYDYETKYNLHPFMFNIWDNRELSDVKHIRVKESPKNFIVLTNYPNPFNPSTKIHFTLPQSDQVSLTIFDMTGKTVAQFGTRLYAAGAHSVEWTPENQASGTFICRLETSKERNIIKMVYIK